MLGGICTLGGVCMFGDMRGADGVDADAEGGGTCATPGISPAWSVLSPVSVAVAVLTMRMYSEDASCLNGY